MSGAAQVLSHIFTLTHTHSSRRDVSEGSASIFSLSSILSSLSDVFTHAKKMVGVEMQSEELKIMQVCERACVYVPCVFVS